MITFELVKRETVTGGQTLALVKTTTLDTGADPIVEEWCTVDDLDRLFDACVRRWPDGWDLEQVLEAIRTSEVD